MRGICFVVTFFLRRVRASIIAGMIVRGGFPAIECSGLDFVVMSRVDRTQFLSQEQLRIQTKYQGRIYAIPIFAVYLWCGIVQRIEMVDEDV